MPRFQRSFDLLAGLLAGAGTVIYLWGGAHHPAAGANLGPLNSEQYWRSFAEHIARHPDWIGIHTAILLGPLLWLLGSGPVLAVLWQAGESRWSLAAGTALVTGTALWAVAFSFDGFVAPYTAQAVVAASPAKAPILLTQLQGTQNAVIRLGLVSWTLIGLGMAALSASFLAASLLRPVTRWTLAASGIALGLWPALAWALRIYYPGPFISGYWIPNATLTGAWFLALGVALAAGRVGRPAG